MEKFAVLTDSGADTPPKYIDDYPVYVVPLSVIFKEGTYRDNVDITADEVVRHFDREIPTTSLPTVGQIDGIYETVKKARGWSKAVTTAIDQAPDFRKGASNYNIAVAHSNTKEEADSILSKLKKQLPGYKQAFLSTVSSALTVHTGPGLIGVGLQRLPD